MNNGFAVRVDEVKSRLKRGEKLFFINIRHHHDWDVGFLKAAGAFRVNDDEVEEELDRVPHDRPVIIYSSCPGDEPSIRAARLLKERGWEDVHPLLGGFSAYLEAGLPVDEINEGSTTRKTRFL